MKHCPRPEALNPPSPVTIYYGLLPLMIIFQVLGDRGSTCCKDAVPMEKSESTLSSENKNISPSLQNVLDVDDFKRCGYMTGNRQAVQKLLNDRQPFAHAQFSFFNLARF